MIIYSAPTGFEGSALHARILGTGIVVCELTGFPQAVSFGQLVRGGKIPHHIEELQLQRPWSI